MASKKELRALITLAGKVDPSLQSAFMKASAQSSMTSGKMAKLQSIASKGMKLVGKAAVVAGTAIVTGIGAGTAALTGLTVEASKAGDSLVKMRDKTGLTLEELQRLQYITGQVGANFESLPQAIGIMTKYMDAAKKGSKEARISFKALGVEYRDTVTGKLRPQSEVFKEVLQQLSNIEDESERNALAFKFFGRGAADLFPLLNAGSGEIERMAAEADRLGLVMSSDTIEKLDELGDTMDRLKMAGRGAGNRLIARLLPNIMPLLNGMIDKLPLVENMLSKGITAFERLGAGAGPVVMDLLSKLMPIIAGVGQSLMTHLMSVLPYLPMVTKPFMQILMMILPLLKSLMPIISFVAKALLVVLGGALQFLLPILQGFVNIITALLDGLTWLGSGIGKVLGISDKSITANAGKSSTSSFGEKKHPTNPRAMKRHAWGGFSNRPAIFGDDGLEAAIPIRRDARSLGLLNQTAKMIGAAPGGNPIQLNFAPVYYGNAVQEIRDEFERQYEQLQMMLDDIMEGKARAQYG